MAWKSCEKNWNFSFFFTLLSDNFVVDLGRALRVYRNIGKSVLMIFFICYMVLFLFWGKCLYFSGKHFTVRFALRLDCFGWFSLVLFKGKHPWNFLVRYSEELECHLVVILFYDFLIMIYLPFVSLSYFFLRLFFCWMRDVDSFLELAGNQYWLYRGDLCYIIMFSK